MSTDLYCVLQKLDKETNRFETVLTNVFGHDRQLMDFLGPAMGYTQYDNISHPGLPKDFVQSETNYVGMCGFGHLTLGEFCEARLPPPPKISDRVEYETHDSGYTVTFIDNDEADTYYSIRAYQYALRQFFQTGFEGKDYGETYRLVFGYS